MSRITPSAARGRVGAQGAGEELMMPPTEIFLGRKTCAIPRPLPKEPFPRRCLHVRRGRCQADIRIVLQRPSIRGLQWFTGHRWRGEWVQPATGDVFRITAWASPSGRRHRLHVSRSPADAVNSWFARKVVVDRWGDGPPPTVIEGLPLSQQAAKRTEVPNADRN